jgi:hypothetical protein
MRRFGLWRLGALTVVAAVLSMTFGVVAAPAATIGGFGVRPANPDPNNPATRAYFVIHAGDGSTRREQVVVTNRNSTPLTLEVDAVDGLTGVTSGVVYANRGVAATAAGAWVTPSARSITVAPHRSIDVAFLVRVPRRAAVGDHLAGIAFEALKPTRSGGGFAVTVVVRTVVGIEVEVPGRATAHLRFFSLALAPLPGTTVPSAVATLEDDGHKLCHPQLTVAITGHSGTASVTQKLGTLLPGDRIAFPFRWPGALMEGTYRVSARAIDCGPPASIEAVAAYSLTTPATAARGTSTVGPTTPLAIASSGWAWWLYALVGLGGMLAGGAIVLVRVGRRRGA